MSSKAVPIRTSLSEWGPARKAFLIPMITSALLIILLFLASMSYLFGTSFEEGKRLHAFKILAVDFDGGAVGSAVSLASRRLQAETFPTIDFGSVSEYPTPAAVKKAVCRGNYWGAIYVHEGASARLASAIASSSNNNNNKDNKDNNDNNSNEKPYDAAAAITYTFNQARYTPFANSVISSGIQEVVAASRGAYYQTPNGTAALRALNTSDAAAVAAYLDPIRSTPDLIRPTTQGSAALFNTVNIIIPILVQFFYVLALNGIGARTGFLARTRVRDVWLLRLALGKVYGLVASVTAAGYIWAFREDWAVGGGEFGKTVLVFWLFMDVQWLVFESLIGSFVRPDLMPFFLLPWIIMNVASTIIPLEAMPAFYRLGYAMPAHEAYSLMVLAWSGCADPTRVALPVLFSWSVLGHVLTVFSVRKRCADAARMAAGAAAAAAASASARNTADSDADAEEESSEMENPTPPRSAGTMTLPMDEEQSQNEKFPTASSSSNTQR